MILPNGRRLRIKPSEVGKNTIFRFVGGHVFPIDLRKLRKNIALAGIGAGILGAGFAAASRGEEEEGVGTGLKVLGGVAAVAAIGIGIELSRRTKVFRGSEFDIIQRKAVFASTVTLTARATNPVSRMANVLAGGSPSGPIISQAILRPETRRVVVESIQGFDSRANIRVLSQIIRFAKKRKAKSITALLANKEIASVIHKRGGMLIGLSGPTGSEGKRIGLPAAKGQIDRLLKGDPKGVVMAILPIKKDK